MSKRRNRSSCSETIANFDMFSTNITLTYKGDTAFTTDVGAVMSIVCLILIAIYSVYGIISVSTNQMVSFQSQLQFLNTDLEKESELHPVLHDFHAAIGISGLALDPAYGTI
jgi:hypothetical protein